MDYNYFDTIDTEEKAYWLGFLFADGNISKSSYMRKNGKIKNGVYKIEVSLKSEDTEHLEKFAKALNYNKPIKISKASFDKKRCRLQFNNKHMWTTLNALGCTPNKSLTLNFPKLEMFKNKWLIYSFIRGYVDGDGNIGFCDKNHTKMQLRILGTAEFLTKLQQQLPLECDNKLIKDGNIYQLIFNAKRGAYVCSILYKGSSIYLNRKFSLYEKYCRLYEGSYRSLSSKYGEDCDVNPVVNSEIAKGSESPYSVEVE